MNITIVGGGTAGWLAALMISKIQKDLHTVTIIDSSAIGIIGAGEASTGYLRGIVNNEIWDFGCNEFDFFKECKAKRLFPFIIRLSSNEIFLTGLSPLSVYLLSEL